ncbi:MAG: hypothetical protein AABX75_01245 [Nanoarchaeota archaeon]
MENIGQAYGFFYCAAQTAAVKAELPDAKRLSNAPSELELTLIDGMPAIMKHVQRDSKLVALAEEAGQSGDNFLLHAKLPGGTNKDAAKHLAGVLNRLYCSSLYAPGDEFKSDITYLENGEYVLQD